MLKRAFLIFIFVFSTIIFLLIACPGPSPAPSTTPTPSPSPTLKPGLIDDWPEDSILTRTEETHYHIIISLEITNNNYDPALLSVLFPVPQSNMYQDIDNINLHGGEELTIPDTSDIYVRFLISENLPENGQSITCTIEYDATLYNIQADTDSVTTINPYNTDSDIYTYYRGNSGDLIDITYSEIQTIGDSLWGSSSNALDYVYNCYEYVALNFEYLNEYTGLHDMATLFGWGGGDCGNLSSIFISLLRYKDIPARHLVTIRPNGSYHVWADFYLEGYGWIPVDVTYALDDAEEDDIIDGDYFGDVAVGKNGIIMTKEVYITVHRGDTEVILNLFQSFAWWYSGSGSGDMSANFTVQSN